MDPKDYKGKEFDDLLRGMNARGIKLSMKRAVRAEAKKALGIARRALAGSSLRTPGITWKPTKKHPAHEGDTADWGKAIRSHIYSDRYGLGFLITVKAHRASKKQMAEGDPGKGMHRNRRGFFKPVLMFAEEGTKPRMRGGKKIRVKHGIYGTHRSSKTQYWTETIRKDGSSTGKMPAYGFLEKATPEMFSAVESGLTPEVEVAVMKVARKYGFTG